MYRQMVADGVPAVKTGTPRRAPVAPACGPVPPRLRVQALVRPPLEVTPPHAHSAAQLPGLRPALVEPLPDGGVRDCQRQGEVLDRQQLGEAALPTHWDT